MHCRVCCIAWGPFNRHSHLGCGDCRCYASSALDLLSAPEGLLSASVILEECIRPLREFRRIPEHLKMNASVVFRKTNAYSSSGNLKHSYKEIRFCKNRKLVRFDRARFVIKTSSQHCLTIRDHEGGSILASAAQL